MTPDGYERLKQSMERDEKLMEEHFSDLDSLTDEKAQEIIESLRKTNTLARNRGEIKE